MKAADMLPFFIPFLSNPLEIGKKSPSTNYPRTIHEVLNHLWECLVICSAVDIDRVTKLFLL